MAHPAEKWFSGKSLETFRGYVLPTLEEAKKLGYWPKGAARKVVAALNKQNEAQKFIKRLEHVAREMVVQYPHERMTALDSLKIPKKDPGDWKEPQICGYSISHAMRFGIVAQAPYALDIAKKLAPLAETSEQKAALATATQWAEDFVEIAELIKLFDSRKAAMTIRFGGLSVTVIKNLGAEMGIALTDIRPCPMRMEWVDTVDELGKKIQKAVFYLDWPKGIKHNTSRFAANAFTQCHACGHGIRNAYNWIPMIGETPKGPVSIWVGRDCAKKLFDVEASGEGEFEEVMSDLAIQKLGKSRHG